jgi:hypothetical protein
VSIDLLSPLFAGWTRLEEPTAELPCWHEADGTPYTVHDISAGLSADTVDEIYQRHASAIRRLVLAASDAVRSGDHAEARRLACAAGRLCEEVVGLWPISGRVIGG